MREFLWNFVADIVSRPRVAQWLITRSLKTPYMHLTARNNADDVYMGRWWLFNPYAKNEDGSTRPARWSWLPSIRIHHIQRPDDAPHMHDHPFNARTILLRGWYLEERPSGAGAWCRPRSLWIRKTGYTGRVLFGQYHHISRVSDGGVYTLWFSWGYRGTWGFLVDGKKVPYTEYLK